jgi:RNA polymerase sigma-70 factor (ECF subfamily)
MEMVEMRPPQSDLRSHTTRTGLVEEFFMDVYGVCFRILGRPYDAEDATQETFLALFRDLGKLDRADSRRGWVLAVARNTAVSLARSRKGTAPLLDGEAPALPIEEPLDRPRLHQALLTLKEEDRRLLEMRFLEEKSAGEMSQETGKNRGALATALCRALKRLRDIYHGRGVR